MKKLSLPKVVSLTGALFLLTTQPVISQSGSAPSEGIGIIPARPKDSSGSTGWFVYELEPGEEQVDQVAVVNLYQEPTQVKLYPVDATATKDGAFALEQEHEPKDDLGAWLKLEKTDLNLLPQQRQLVNFTLGVPETAEPGDHLGGIIVQKVATASGNRAIKTVTRTGVRVYLTVPGEATRLLKLLSVSVEMQTDQPVFKLRLRNEGNTRIEGFETELILNNRWWFGPTRVEIVPSQAVVFPNKEVEVEIPWQGGLDVLGSYEALVTINYAGEDALSETLFFKNFKKKQGLLLLCGVGIGGLFSIVLLITIFRFWRSLIRRVLGRLRKKSPPTTHQKIRSPELTAAEKEESRLSQHPQPTLNNELKFEIRRIIREELELARLADQFKNGSYSPGDGQDSPPQPKRRRKK